MWVLGIKSRSYRRAAGTLTNGLPLQAGMESWVCTSCLQRQVDDPRTLDNQLPSVFLPEPVKLLPIQKCLGSSLAELYMSLGVSSNTDPFGLEAGKLLA